ncbi:hypothetical protein BD626DRAFT_541160 [Schizophyllum amplum]|uniref:Uncharacterized protein n=1 Tax=Schizophyllum amplum TaxID=97359 RepID=A0A550BVV8_9AGAR|nr:hypothetical protein BD626DRAFT_541160 [Auriculariopsis ampla]
MPESPSTSFSYWKARLDGQACTVVTSPQERRRTNFLLAPETPSPSYSHSTSSRRLLIHLTPNAAPYRKTQMFALRTPSAFLCTISRSSTVQNPAREFLEHGGAQSSTRPWWIRTAAPRAAVYFSRAAALRALRLLASTPFSPPRTIGGAGRAARCTLRSVETGQVKCPGIRAGILADDFETLGPGRAATLITLACRTVYSDESRCLLMRVALSALACRAVCSCVSRCLLWRATGSRPKSHVDEAKNRQNASQMSRNPRGNV